VAFAAWPDPLKDGPCALERVLCAADHDGERAVACAFDAAAHGRIEEIGAALAQPMRCRARGIGANGGTIDHQRSGFDCGKNGIDDREHVGIGGNAHHDGVAGRCELVWRRRGLHAGSCCKDLRLFGGAIPDCLEHAGTVQVVGHPQAHRRGR
jgi:hypothetical protein